MSTRPRLAGVIAAVAALLAGSPRASAESVTLRFDHMTGNPSVTTSLGNNVPTGPFYWVENNLPPNTNFPPPTSTFCIEIGGPLPNPGSAVFTVQLPATYAPIGPADANAVSELYGRFYDTAWDSAAFGGSTSSVAFQLALWEIVSDGTPTAGNPDELANGTFNTPALVGTSAYTTARDMLNALTGDTSSFASRFGDRELVTLHAPEPDGKFDWQDQIALRPTPAVVPAPPGVVLAGIGFLGLVGRSRWLRRQPTA